MKKNKLNKWLILLPVVLVVIGIIGYLFRPVPDCVCNRASKESLLASQLMEQFETNEQQANINYLGKIITVEGKITSVSVDDKGRAIVELESQSTGVISCTFCKKESKAEILTEGKLVSIKGECTGFTFDVVMVKCCLME